MNDNLSSMEKKILDAAEASLFGNPEFLQSKFGPDDWSPELRNASVQAVTLMMNEINIEKKSNGKHIVSWDVDSLDRVLDGLGIYPDKCVHCYGKEGYDTLDGLDENYGVILTDGHVHREMLKTFAYFAKAEGMEILPRSFLENNAEDMELLYKRKLDRIPSVVGAGSFAYENVSFMSYIELPDGTIVSYPTMAFGMAGNAQNHRQAVENVFDYMRTELKHFTGDLENFADIYRPYTSTPYSPELGWIVEIGEAGSPSAAGAITGALRALGFQAEQFASPRNNRNAGSVQVYQNTYYYNGNYFSQ